MVQENEIHCNCWFAYFDQLGFKHDIEHFVESSPNNLNTFATVKYESILDTIKYVLKRFKGKIIPWWFSDTFLFFSTDESHQSFLYLQSVVKRFLTSVTYGRKPFRGAISYGELYADMEKKILISQALIDAHEYAEKQNWIGLVLTPSAREQINNVVPKVLDGGFHRYEYDVPVYVDSTKKEGTEKLLALDISQHSLIRKRIEQMRQEAENKSDVQDRESIRVKYDNTIKFFDWCKNK